MQVYVKKFHFNDEIIKDISDFPFIRITVCFDGENIPNTPQNSAKVTVFIPKQNDLTLENAKALAIQKAREFLISVISPC